MSIVAESSALESTVKRLAGVVGVKAPVTTVYLDVDGRRHPRHTDLDRHFATLVRRARPALNGSAANPSVETDLRRMSEWLRGFDRGRTRGVVFVACSVQDVFDVVELPVPVRDRVAINHSPALGQLEAVLQDLEPIGVLLADRQKARMLVFELGELTDRSELFDEVVHGDAGHHDRGDLAHAMAAATHTHLRNAAEVAWRQYQARPFSHLAIGAPDAIAGELTALLHPYLRERLVGRLAVTVGAGLADIRAAAMEVERRVERKREATVVARLRQAQSGGRGVTGLRDTLRAINERRVERLLVSDGFSSGGWRCPESGVLTAVGPTSPATGRRMDKVDDVVEDAIDAAINQGCQVDICVGNPDLDVLGRIGALLRY